MRFVRVLGWLVLAMLAIPAAAHQAPSGWSYDTACCNTHDCGPAPVGSITEERQGRVLGYRVLIPAGGHHNYPGAVDVFIPADSSKVRRSGDSDFHACVRQTGEVLCIYVPLGAS